MAQSSYRHLPNGKQVKRTYTLDIPASGLDSYLAMVERDSSRTVTFVERAADDHVRVHITFVAQKWEVA